MEKTWNYANRFAIGLAIIFFLGLEDYANELQFQIIFADINKYYSINHKMPNSLSDLYKLETMTRTAHLSLFNYQSKKISKWKFKTKLEFSNIWGTVYYYCDKCGEIEKEKNENLGGHWNEYTFN
jgi:hypothetical protein